MSEQKPSQDSNPHPWDPYSDQPYIIKDKAYKKRMKKKHLKDYLLTFFTSCIIFPVALVAWLFNRKHEPAGNHFFSLCVNLDKGREQYALVDELGCQSVQVRFFLSEMDRLEEYYRFVEGFSGKQVLLVIVQSRQHIDDQALLAADIDTVFEQFSPLVQQFQIGTTINRSKWGFFSVGEYLRFYQVVQRVRNERFPKLQLLGPSVIDFEYPYLIRALFNGFSVRFDKISALLYVDRRGAPENTQMGVFDTLNKIGLLHTITRLSSKTSSRILLTEANWPLEKTAPWAPTSETECVSESDYANFMLRYFLQALASRRVESVYWHQLIAPGYGLVDSREGLRKRHAFYVFKVMISYLDNVEVINYRTLDNVYELSCFDPNAGRDIVVLWSNGSEESLLTHLQARAINLEGRKLVDKAGHYLEADSTTITDSPIYIV